MIRIIVVGGGAAGMMAALSAKNADTRVILLEKNEKLGKKLFITGKGRCNVTNAADMDILFENVCTSPKFLYSAFYQYDNRAVMDFLEQNGCPLKVERGDRVFPVSDHSSDVIRALQRALEKKGVEIHLNSSVKDLIVRDGHAAGVLLDDGKTLEADRVILCTGGISYPSCGSTGEGHEMVRRQGHGITALKPALVPLETKEEWCRSLMGLSLKNVSVRMMQEKKEIFSGFGEMLFTHFGVSGPLILSASSFYAKQKNREQIQLYIDLEPALTREQLDKRILRDFEENRGKQFKNSLSGLFPARLIPVMITLSGIDPEKRTGEISKEERLRFVDLIKAVPLSVTGTRSFAEAIITQGGVSVKEVNPSTMESKLVSGLYLAGELLDLDAMTGGFNLQIAWSTGHLAGVSAAVPE